MITMTIVSALQLPVCGAGCIIIMIKTSLYHYYDKNPYFTIIFVKTVNQIDSNGRYESDNDALLFALFHRHDFRDALKQKCFMP